MGEEERTMGLAMTLEKLQNGHVIERYELIGDKRRIYKIGRVPSSDVWVDDPVAARLHAIIDLSNKRAVIRDMGTPVGTTVNGLKIERATLRSDDVIRIGDTSFHVVLAGRGLDRPPPIPSSDERRREGFIDAVATMTPHSTDQLQMYAEFLRQRKKRGIVRHDDRARLHGAILGARNEDEPARHHVSDSQIVEALDTRGEPAAAKSAPQPVAAAAPQRAQLQRRLAYYAAGALLGAVVGVTALPFDVSDGEPTAEPALAEPLPAPPAAPSPVVAPPPSARSYTVRPGDTLGDIARRELGSVGAWERLWQHNVRILPDPSKIEVGMLLEIPAL